MVVMKYNSKINFKELSIKKLPKPIKNITDTIKAKTVVKKLIKGTIVFAVLLSVISSYIWYTRVYLNTERRFWGAIENNLTINSVVRETRGGGSGNKSNEKTRFEFASQASQNKISSVSVKSATVESNVTTESILTPNAQYVRYLNVFSNQKKADGSNFDFSKITNVWAKQIGRAHV